MFSTTIDSMRRNRAVYARDIEYLKESVRENKIDDYMEAGESLFFKESTDDLLEAKEFDQYFTADESESAEKELDRILNTKEDLTFDQMIGIPALKDLNYEDLI